MLRLILIIGMCSLLSTCLGAGGPFGGEDPIRGNVIRYYDVGGHSGVQESYQLSLDTDVINTKGVRPYDCLYYVELTVQREEHPEAYKRLHSLNESGALEGAYLEFKGITQETDLPNEFMVITELIDSRAAPAGKIWSNWYCEERNKAE